MLNQIPRQQDTQNVQLPDQQLRHSGTDGGRALSLSMTGGTLLQMDQAAPAHQILLRHLRECREESEMDRHLGLCACGHH